MTAKIQTPMNRLKSHFLLFNKNVLSMGITLDEHQHRKESYSRFAGSGYYREGGVKKAIESDFLRVYRLDEDTSFAFKFTFLSEDKSEVVEPQYLELNFKEGKKIFNSKIYNMEESKDLLRSINSLLKVNQISKNKKSKKFLYDFLKDLVVMSKEETNEEENEFLESFNIESAELQSHLFAEIEYENNLEKNIKTNENKLRTFKKNLPEEIRLNEISKEAIKLKEVIKKKVCEKKQALKIDENIDNKEKAKRKVSKLRQNLINLARKINGVHKLPLKTIDLLVGNIINK